MHIRQLALSLLPAVVTAQTYTSCQPLNTDAGLNQKTLSVDFTKGESDLFNVTYGSVDYDKTNGATFTINKKGDAPKMVSNFYFMFGVVSIMMKASSGQGIVSSAYILSDDLDEIDMEFIGGTNNQLQTNYFGKGNDTTFDRGTFVDVADTQGKTHNYTVEWTADYTKWYVDGAVVRTLLPANALAGQNYPQTPMQVILGNWAGGDPDNAKGTIEWAGGETDYTKGPYKMYVSRVDITNYNPAASYTYGDTSGSRESIKMSNETVTPTTSNSGSGSNNSTSTSSSETASSTSSSDSTGSSSGSSSGSSTDSTSSSSSTSAANLNSSGAYVTPSHGSIFALAAAALMAALL